MIFQWSRLPVMRRVAHDVFGMITLMDAEDVCRLLLCSVAHQLFTVDSGRDAFYCNVPSTLQRVKAIVRFFPFQLLLYVYYIIHWNRKHQVLAHYNWTSCPRWPTCCLMLRNPFIFQSLTFPHLQMGTIVL